MHEATERLIRATMEGRWALAEHDLESDMELGEDLGLDEIDKAELAINVDLEFDVEITDEEIEGWVTVGDVDATVTRLVTENAE